MSMLGKSDEYIGVSLSDTALKVVHVKGTGGTPKILGIHSESVQGQSEADLPKTIQSALKKFNLKTAQIVSIIPPSMTTTKNIEIPSVNPEEIRSIVSLQAGRHTPFSREEIQVGYVNVGVHNNNYSKVLLVIANRNILKNQLSIFEKAGLKVRKVLFAPEGISSYYASSIGDATGPVGLVDVDNASTDFIVMDKGKPIMTRTIPVGRSHLNSDPGGSQEKLTAELAKTIEAYQSEDIGEVPSKHVLTSDDSATQGLQQVIATKLSWNVEVVPYINAIEASPETLEELGNVYAEHSFIDVIAPTSTVGDAEVNLIPEEIQLQKSVEDQGKAILKTAIFAIVLLVLVAFTFGLKMYFKTAYLEKLKNEYQGNRDEVAALQDLSTKTMIIKNYLGERMVSLDVINELYRNVPDQIYLTSVLMNEDGSLSIQGISDIASLVFNLGTRLKESDLFKSVEIKSTTAKKDRGKDVSAFEIALVLFNSDISEEKEAQILEE